MKKAAKKKSPAKKSPAKKSVVTKPTAEAIKAEIEALKTLKAKVPVLTFFGDNNHDAIDAQIETLERDFSFDTIWNRGPQEDNEDDCSESDWSESERDLALDARRWLDGDESHAPSVDWQELVDARNS